MPTEHELGEACRVRPRKRQGRPLAHMKEKTAVFLMLQAFTLWFSPAQASYTIPHLVGANALNVRSAPNAPVDLSIKVSVEPLTTKEQSSLLAHRINGALGGTFERFANMFVVSSSISTGTTIGLVTESSEIENSSFNPAFPTSYKPTIREFLEAIATQTGSSWSYDPSGKFIHTDKQLKKPIKNTAIFEFRKSEQPGSPPYAVSVPAHWKAIQKNGVTHYITSSEEPIVDIYEFGSYSGTNPDDDAQLQKSLPSEIALTWAKMIKPSATKDELKQTKLGKYEAVMFETVVTGKEQQQIMWRNWGVAVGNRGFAVLSTLRLSDDDKLFPDVRTMLDSLVIK